MSKANVRSVIDCCRTTMSQIRYATSLIPISHMQRPSCLLTFVNYVEQLSERSHVEAWPYGSTVHVNELCVLGLNLQRGGTRFGEKGKWRVRAIAHDAQKHVTHSNTLSLQ